MRHLVGLTALLLILGCSDRAPDAPRATEDMPAPGPTEPSTAPPSEKVEPSAAPSEKAEPPAPPIATDRATTEAWFAAYCPSGGDNFVHAPEGMHFPRADVPFDPATAPPISPHLSVTPTGMQTERGALAGAPPTPLTAKNAADAAGRAADREAVKSRLGSYANRVLIDARVPGWRAYDILSAAPVSVEIMVASSRAPALPAVPEPARIATLMAEMKARPMATDRSRWLAGLAKVNAEACPAVADAYGKAGDVQPDKRCAHLSGLLSEAIATCPPDAARGVMTLQYLLHPKVPYLRPQPWRAPATSPAWAAAETPWGEIVPGLMEKTAAP